jgi:hypothetical protein
MGYREDEAAVVERCVLLATASDMRARSNEEASLSYVASTMVRPYFPGATQRLRQVTDEYFESHPQEVRLEGQELLSKLGIVSFPRLRTTLLQALEKRK